MSRSLSCVLAVSLLSASVASAADSRPERSFAVVPQLSPTKLVREWQPLLNLLDARTGIRFHFVTAPTISEFEQRVLAGKYDYVYMNAALGRNAHRRGTYRLLARRRPDLHGIIVVRRNGPDSLTQLRDKVIAYPAPYAYGATQLNRAHLRALHIQHRVAFLGSHESVYRAVARGQFIAGGGIDRSLELLPAKVRAQLRILYRTPAAPSHEIAALSRLNRTETRRVAKALLNLGQDERSRKLLAALDIDGFRRGTAEDDVRLLTSGVVRHKRPRTIDFLVIPRLSRKDTLRQMQPLAAYFKQRLEINVSLHTFETMASFAKAIRNEHKPALINANPLQAVRLARRGFRIFAQQVPVQSPKGVRSIILVRADSDIHSIGDLRGKRIAFAGSPNAFFASVVPHVLLKRAGLDGAYQDASKTGPIAESVGRLRRGEVDAACVANMALHSRGLQQRYDVDRMRVVAQSEPMPGLAWLLSPAVGAELGNEIRHLFLGYGPDDPGHSALTAAGISGLRPASRKDYRIVERYMRELHGR